MGVESPRGKVIERELAVLGPNGVAELTYQIEALEGQIMPRVPLTFRGLQALLEMVYDILAVRDIDEYSAGGCGPVTALVAKAFRAVEGGAGTIYCYGGAS